MPVNFIVIDKCQQLKGGIVGTQRMGCRSHSKATGRGWRSSCRWPVRGSAHKEDGSPLRAESCLVPPVGPSYHFTFIEFVTTLLLFTFWIFWPGGMWDLRSWPGLRPAPPALEGEVLTPGPPGGPSLNFCAYPPHPDFLGTVHSEELSLKHCHSQPVYDTRLTMQSVFRHLAWAVSLLRTWLEGLQYANSLCISALSRARGCAGSLACFPAVLSLPS